MKTKRVDSRTVEVVTNQLAFPIGTLEKWEDGFFYFRHDYGNTGVFAEHHLREIAEMLKDLNNEASKLTH